MVNIRVSKGKRKSGDDTFLSLAPFDVGVVGEHAAHLLAAHDPYEPCETPTEAHTQFVWTCEGGLFSPLSIYIMGRGTTGFQES